MNLPEATALRLFAKHGILHPKINPKSGKVVVKADLARGGKKKAGLVQFGDASEVSKISKKMGVPTVVFEFIPHSEEFFVALKAVREGVEIYYSHLGGIEIEQNWEKVEKILYDEKKLFDLVPDKNVRDWIVKLYEFFQEEDAVYLEINPFTVVNKQVMPLGVVLVLDEAAAYRHPDWPEIADEAKTLREKRVAEVDAEIRGSIKLVEVSGGGNTGLMAGGAGAALFLCDAILKNGLTLANYAEFSGNPPSFAVSELVKQICAIPGVKNLVIGSGIANFTDVYSNFQGIIQGLSEAPQAKKMKIVVQRLGPGEDLGMDLMKDFIKKSGLNIQVFDRSVGMTEIVKKLQ